MGYFPFFVDLEGKNCLIVGGGKVAAHKLNKLLPFNPKFKIVAPQISDQIITLATNNPNIELFERDVTPDDLNGTDFCIAASKDSTVNGLISNLCHNQNIPINVVDDKDKCSFIFPSLIQKGKLTVGISTAGTSPEVAASIKNETAKFIPSQIEDILEYLSSIRLLAKSQITDDSLRAKFLKDTAKECMDRNGIFSQEETLSRLENYVNNKTTTKGKVSLVGAGCGGYDLVTLKGIQAIRGANVLIYDDLIDTRLLEFSSESCEKIYVGKRSGKHSMKQEAISQLLLSKAQEGKYVVRLKGGDPFVFGRASEEMETLKAGNVEYDYIPGITSAIAVPGLAGIPVTSRNLSRSFHVITGHTSNSKDSLPEDLETLAKINGTLIFLMGLENLNNITSVLIENGKAKDTPIAIIHANVDNTTDIIKSTLSNIVTKTDAVNIKSPAIIIIGDVVSNYNDK